MVLDSLKGVAVPKSVCLMWQSTISMGKNFLVWLSRICIMREADLQLFIEILNIFILAVILLMLCLGFTILYRWLHLYNITPHLFITRFIITQFPI